MSQDQSLFADHHPPIIRNAGERARPCSPYAYHDCKVAEACLTALLPTAHLAPDTVYDSQKLRDWLEMRGAEPVITPRSNRKVQYAYDKATCHERNVIARMFCGLKHWRRIATRFDGNITGFMSVIALAAAV